MRKLLLEALLVAAAGALVAFMANAVSPRGLKLSRDYFPVKAVPAPLAVTHVITGVPGSNAVSSVDQVIERLRGKGLGYTLTKEAAELYRDPNYQQTIIFIDARDDQHYQAGHVPGAFQLDYYRPESYLPLVLPMTQVAEKIVLYCNGGDCQDSEWTALLLRDAGVPMEKLTVYVGGFTDWSTNNLPVEIGQRMSGAIRNGN